MYHEYHIKSVGKIQLRWSGYLGDAFRMFMFEVFWAFSTERGFCSAPELAGGTIQCIPSGLAVPFGPQGEMLPGRMWLWKRDVWNNLASLLEDK